MPIHVTDTTFDEEVLGAESVVLVDFWAPWCGPCHAVAPVLEKIEGEKKDTLTLAKVNIDENPAIAQRYGIMSIPTLVVFHGGEPVEGTVGAVPYGPLNDWIDGLIERLQTQEPAAQ
jgi:thioredoxin 1